MPAPPSDTASSQAAVHRQLHRTGAPGACRAALVSASTAIRYAATSTAAGSAGSGSGTSTTARAEPGAPVRARAPARPELVQDRRAQVVDDPPDVVDRRFACLRAARRAGPRPALPGAAAAYRVDAQRDPGERRAEPVVQVAAQPPALLLARRHEPLAGVPQRLGQRHRVGHDRHLPREVGEQRLVGAGDVVVPGLRRQPADRLAGERQRHLAGPPPGQRAAVRRHQPTVRPRRHIRQSQRFGHRTRGGAQLPPGAPAASRRSPSRAIADAGSSRNPYTRWLVLSLQRRRAAAARRAPPPRSRPPAARGRARTAR